MQGKAFYLGNVGETKFNKARLSKNQKAVQSSLKGDLEVSRTTSTDVGKTAAAEVSGGAAGVGLDEEE